MIFIHSSQVSITTFPIFWIILAVICIVFGIYFAMFGYKRYQGGKHLFLIETFGLWLDRIIKGEEVSKKEKMRIEMDQQRNRLVGISSMVSSIGCLLLATLLIIAAFLVSNLGR